jgi:predicted nicotinamide N-methyase
MIQTPEDNTFTRQPEFITRDHRQYRPVDIDQAGQPYTVTTDFMFNRHRVMIPPELIKDKTVLDVGSCYGATGAWCLDNGAKHYTGLEPQRKFVEDSRNILGMYYKPEQYEVIEEPLDTFNTDRKWDVVIASGVIYGVFDQYECIRKLTSLGKESIIVESQHPFSSGKLLFARPPSSDWTRERMRTLKIIQVIDDWPMMIDAESNSNFVYTGAIISSGALAILFKHYGWAFDDTSYLQAELEIPEHYDPGHPSGRRYMARFYPSNVRSPTFTDVYNSPIAKRVKWSGNSTNE